MQRTTLVLPPRLKETAVQHARAAGLSFAEFVRRAIETAISDTAGRRRGQRDSLLDDTALFHGKVPHDLSSRHDAYLYGDR